MPPPADASVPYVADSATLAGHHWRLASATDADGARIDALFPGTDHVLTLEFADSRVSVSGGCNGQGASYAVGDGGKLDDRKRVVEGRGVSVRVCCGWQRMI